VSSPSGSGRSPAAKQFFGAIPTLYIQSLLMGSLWVVDVLTTVEFFTFLVIAMARLSKNFDGVSVGARAPCAPPPLAAPLIIVAGGLILIYDFVCSQDREGCPVPPCQNLS